MIRANYSSKLYFKLNVKSKYLPYWLYPMSFFQRHLEAFWLQEYSVFIEKVFWSSWIIRGKRGKERHVVPADKGSVSVFINVHSQDNSSNLVKGPLLWAYISKSFYSSTPQQTGVQVSCISPVLCFGWFSEKFFSLTMGGTTHSKKE